MHSPCSASSVPNRSGVASDVHICGCMGMSGSSVSMLAASCASSAALPLSFSLAALLRFSLARASSVLRSLVMRLISGSMMVA